MEGDETDCCVDGSLLLAVIWLGLCEGGWAQSESQAQVRSGLGWHSTHLKEPRSAPRNEKTQGQGQGRGGSVLSCLGTSAW